VAGITTEGPRIRCTDLSSHVLQGLPRIPYLVQGTPRRRNRGSSLYQGSTHPAGERRGPRWRGVVRRRRQERNREPLRRGRASRGKGRRVGWPRSRNSRRVCGAWGWKGGRAWAWALVEAERKSTSRGVEEKGGCWGGEGEAEGGERIRELEKQVKQQAEEVEQLRNEQAAWREEREELLGGGEWGRGEEMGGAPVRHAARGIDMHRVGQVGRSRGMEGGSGGSGGGRQAQRGARRTFLRLGPPITTEKDHWRSYDERRRLPHDCYRGLFSFVIYTSF
jgi:hypothetical protein